MRLLIRKATSLIEVENVAKIYDRIHDQEESGIVSIGWKSGIYPTMQTALHAFDNDTLFVMCLNDRVIASAIINQVQPEEYSTVEWQYQSGKKKVGVLHTLVVHPEFTGQGLGKTFVAYFESYCRDMEYEVVRLDTQVKNTRPFNLYPKLGYRLAAIKLVPFQDVYEEIELAIFEKSLK